VLREQIRMKEKVPAMKQRTKITLDNLAPMGANPNKHNPHAAIARGGHFYRANTEDISKERTLPRIWGGICVSVVIAEVVELSK
jgi:hypothetical protein